MATRAERSFLQDRELAAAMKGAISVAMKQVLHLKSGNISSLLPVLQQNDNPVKVLRLCQVGAEGGGNAACPGAHHRRPPHAARQGPPELAPPPAAQPPAPVPRPQCSSSVLAAP
jgi:hypothetical protein